MTEVSGKTWAAYHGIEFLDSGEAVLFKAVDKDLKSQRGFVYPVDEYVEAADWQAGDFCGGGLHFSPSPVHANYYFSEATRFLRVAVRVKDVSVIGGNSSNTPKVKAKGCRVLGEVDLDGRPV